MDLVETLAFQAVAKERHAQNLKWGVQNHSMEWWLVVLLEEVGEFSRAVLETRFGGLCGGIEEVKKELTQVAAVAVAMLECLGRNGEACLKKAEEAAK